MSPIEEVILNKNVNINPIWIMRQAGRYLPEFRKIRKENPDFIKLCLNEKLSTELTLQPLIRYDLDAAIIFSDILMLPYGLNQKVEFIKGTGPILGNIDLENISKDLSTRKNKLENAISISADEKLSLEDQRSKQLNDIEPTLVSTYEKVLAARGGLAVVNLSGTSCGGCGASVPMQKVAEIRAKVTMHRCDVCGRFLYSEKLSKN